MDDLLTARQVAVRLGVSADTVLRWTREGKLPGFRLPSGAMRYRDADIQQWIEARATTQPCAYCGKVGHDELGCRA